MFISIAQSTAFFCLFIYEILGIDVNFFDRNGPLRKGTKDLIVGWLFCLVSVVVLYLLRTIQSSNNYFFVILLCMSMTLLCISFCHLISINNYLVE